MPRTRPADKKQNGSGRRRAVLQPTSSNSEEYCKQRTMTKNENKQEPRGRLRVRQHGSTAFLTLAFGALVVRTAPRTPSYLQVTSCLT